MSAAEKLQALAVYKDEGWDSGPFDKNERWRAEDLLDVLPQIVAVVEAAERTVKVAAPVPGTSAGYPPAYQLRHALAALDEALSGAEASPTPERT